MKNLSETHVFQQHYSGPTCVSNDREWTNQLLLLSKEKYLLHLDEAFSKEFTYFLENIKAGIPNQRIYDREYVELLYYLFREESLFAEDIITLLEEAYSVELQMDDLITLIELVICSEWSLSFYQHEHEEFTELYAILIKNITLRLSLTIQDMYTGYRSFITHLKFLSYRIITKQRNTEITEDDIYFFTKEKYAYSFNIAHHLRQFITENYDFDLSNDEITFLTMHIQRIVKKNQLVSEVKN